MIEIDERLGFEIAAPEDFRESKLYFGDYIRLRGLRYGDLFYLEKSGGEVQVVLIGNATPYEGPSSVSHDGWYWNAYNHWRVLYHTRIDLERDGSWLPPIEAKKANAGKLDES